MPVKIPTWDTSHLADERYEIAPGICTQCPTMNWDLYRESPVIAELLYTGGYILAAPPIKGKSFLVWNLDHAEQELWKQPPQNREWKGSPAELAQFAQPDMPANRLNKHLNVNAGRLLEENKGVTIRYLPVRRVS